MKIFTTKTPLYFPGSSKVFPSKHYCNLHLCHGPLILPIRGKQKHRPAASLEVKKILHTSFKNKLQSMTHKS